MYKFFYKELIDLKTNTGLNQWLQLKSESEEVDKLIKSLVAETEREPFNMIRLDIKQQVIHDAILNDQEFTGLSVKFIRKTLNFWWSVYGASLAAKRTNEETEQVIQAEACSPEKRLEWLQRWQDSLGQITIKNDMKISRQEIEEEGQIRPKRPVYHSDPAYANEVMKKLRDSQERIVRERHPEFTDEEVKQYLDNL